MGRSLKDIIAALPPEEQAAINARYQDMKQEVEGLRELHETRHDTRLDSREGGAVRGSAALLPLQAAGAADARPDPSRRISVQDCTQPIAADGGNLKCR